MHNYSVATAVISDKIYLVVQDKNGFRITLITEQNTKNFQQWRAKLYTKTYTTL